jgi:hypothetical protein
MADANTERTSLGGALRLTWVTDDLAHVLEHSRSDEPAGTWSGLACPDYGLSIGSEAEDATFRNLARGQLADLIWEAPADFTRQHSELCLAAIQHHQAGHLEQGKQLWEDAQNLWSDAWSASSQALELIQQAGLTSFSPAKPQRWVIASFPHHSGPHGVAQPHVHNIVITELTRAAA